MTDLPDTPSGVATSLWSRRLSSARARLRRGAGFGMGVVAALIAIALYGYAVPAPKPLSQADVAANIASALASVTPGPALSQLAYEAVQPSLVLVQTQGPAGPATGDNGSATPGGSAAPGSSLPAFPEPSGSAALGTSTADGTLGSGVVVDASGDILTCLHLVANATAIQVTFADGTTSPAEITSTQASDDIAVLQAANPPSTITPAVLGNPHSVQVGSEAYVLGSPFGLYGSFTSGVVSGLDRTFQLPDGTQLQGMIQVDAAVNPGSSGGPLVNRDGQVIGIVSGIVNPTNQSVFIGIGFAVPIDVAGGAAGLPHD